MSFWGSLFAGQNRTLDQGINAFGGIGGFATGLGESNIRQGSKFWSDILSGNSARKAQAIAPEISAQAKQLQQGEKTASEFHNRGGGVNSAVQAGLGEARGNINDLVGKLQTTAAGNLESSGSNLLSQGMEAFGEQSALSEEQMQNWERSILGQGIGFGAGFLEGKGLGKLIPVAKGS